MSARSGQFWNAMNSPCKHHAVCVQRRDCWECKHEMVDALITESIATGFAEGVEASAKVCESVAADSTGCSVNASVKNNYDAANRHRAEAVSAGDCATLVRRLVSVAKGSECRDCVGTGRHGGPLANAGPCHWCNGAGQTPAAKGGAK